MSDHFFISYSVADGLDFATNLFNELEGGHPQIDAWLDKNRLKPGDDWDDQLANAISNCKCLVFAMSVDSTSQGSTVPPASRSGHGHSNIRILSCPV